MRALALAMVPDVNSLLTLARVNSCGYSAAMSVFLERIEVSRGTISGLHKLLNKKRYLAQNVRELVISDNWPYCEVWLAPTTAVPSAFAEFWPPLRPFIQIADLFSWVCPRKDQNPDLRIDIALDFWCLKALYEVCRAQKAAASRIRAIRVTGTSPHYNPPTGVKPEDQASFLQQFQGVMWASLDSVVQMSDRLDLFQILPRADTREVVALPATVPMNLADSQQALTSIKLTIAPEHRYALLAFAKHVWPDLSSLSLAFVRPDRYPVEMRELDLMLGRKWLDLTELRIAFPDAGSDALKWSWSHPRLQLLDVDMTKATEERIIKFVHDHPDIQHLSLHSDERCKRPTRYPPKLRSCAILLGATREDPFAAATESNATYVTAVLRSRTWEQELSPQLPWTERLMNLTALDIVLDVIQFTTVCEFFNRANAKFFPNLLEVALINYTKYELTTPTKYLSGSIDFFMYALEHLRFLPRIQVIALNSHLDEALETQAVTTRIYHPAPTLRAAAWLTSSEEAQVFSVDHVPQVKGAALRVVNPFLAGLSRLDCGQEEKGWPYDTSFFLHSPDGRAVSRSPLVSFPG